MKRVKRGYLQIPRGILGISFGTTANLVITKKGVVKIRREAKKK